MEYSFSIVIPVYNAEKYICEMVESIINQTYTKWNLILIDDGSTDSSGSICDTYISDKVQVYHNENQGQSMARRCGIDRATGDYTIVMDADDFITADCLQTLNDILNGKGYDMVIFPYEYCDERLIPMGKARNFPDKIGELEKTEVLQWVIKTGNHGLVNKAVKTDVLKRGIQSAPLKRVKVNGDYLLIIPILCEAESFYFIDKVMYKYRIYGESISHKYTFQHLIDTDFVSQNVWKVLKQHNFTNEEIDNLVIKAYVHMILSMLGMYMKKNSLQYSDLLLLNEQSFFNFSLEYIDKIGLDLYERLELKALKRKSIKRINILQYFMIFEKVKKKFVYLMHVR